MDAVFNFKLKKDERGFETTPIDISGKLRYDAKQDAFYFDNPKIEKTIIKSSDKYLAEAEALNISLKDFRHPIYIEELDAKQVGLWMVLKMLK